jgi:hypothetical protein
MLDEILKKCARSIHFRYSDLKYTVTKETNHLAVVSSIDSRSH